MGVLDSGLSAELWGYWMVLGDGEGALGGPGRLRFLEVPTSEAAI